MLEHTVSNTVNNCQITRQEDFKWSHQREIEILFFEVMDILITLTQMLLNTVIQTDAAHCTP